MRVSDVLGQDVVDASGNRLGVVTDVRCVQDGPLRGMNASLRIDGLLVSRRHTGALLGYDRRDQGPWLLRVIVRLMHRGLREVSWDEVDELGPPLRLKP